MDNEQMIGWMIFFTTLLPIQYFSKHLKIPNWLRTIIGISIVAGFFLFISILAFA